MVTGNGGPAPPIIRCAASMLIHPVPPVHDGSRGPWRHSWNDEILMISTRRAGSRRPAAGPSALGQLPWRSTAEPPFAALVAGAEVVELGGTRVAAAGEVFLTAARVTAARRGRRER